MYHIKHIFCFFIEILELFEILMKNGYFNTRSASYSIKSTSWILNKIIEKTCEESTNNFKLVLEIFRICLEFIWGLFDKNSYFFKTKLSKQA